HAFNPFLGVGARDRATGHWNGPWPSAVLNSSANNSAGLARQSPSQKGTGTSLRSGACPLWFGALNSTFALFPDPELPCFPGVPRWVARVFANPSGSGGVSKLEIAWFSWLFWLVGLRKRAKVELRAQY